jgi:hypothetical protein
MATSSRLASAPNRVNASFATFRTRSRFRCASARGFRAADCEGFVAISKKACNRGQSPTILQIRRLSPFYQIRERLVKTHAYLCHWRYGVFSALLLFRNSLTRAIRCSGLLVRIRVLRPLPRQVSNPDRHAQEHSGSRPRLGSNAKVAMSDISLLTWMVCHHRHRGQAYRCRLRRV